MTSKQSLPRRRILATIGGSGLAALAGCASTKKPDSVNQSKYVTPQTSLDGRWKQINELRVPLTVNGVLGIYVAGSIFSDTEMQKALQIVPQDVDSPLVVIFAAQLNVFKQVPGGNYLYGLVDSKKAVNNAGSRIKQILTTEYGITSLQQANTDGEVPERAEQHRELRGRYPLGQTRTVTLPNNETREVNLTGGLPIKIFYSTWKIQDEEDLLLVGGAYPERSTATLSGSVTGTTGEGIDTRIEVTLPYDPPALRSRILDEISNVKPTVK